MLYLPGPPRFRLDFVSFSSYRTTCLPAYLYVPDEKKEPKIDYPNKSHHKSTTNETMRVNSIKQPLDSLPLQNYWNSGFFEFKWNHWVVEEFRQCGQFRPAFAPTNSLPTQYLTYLLINANASHYSQWVAPFFVQYFKQASLPQHVHYMALMYIDSMYLVGR